MDFEYHANGISLVEASAEADSELAPPSYTENEEQDGGTTLITIRETRLGTQTQDEDDELPGYEPPNVPMYEEPTLQAPSATYIFCQSNRKLQTITPDEQSSSYPSYVVNSRSGPSLFSNKPDMTLTRVSPEPTQTADSLASSGSSSSNNNNNNNNNNRGRSRIRSLVPMGGSVPPVTLMMKLTGETTIVFPWMPRAGITHVDSRATYALSAPNFADWNLRIGERRFTWRLTDHPSTSLILLEHTSNPPGRIVARFSYSRWGTDAVRGAEVGRLYVYDVEDEMPEVFDPEIIAKRERNRWRMVEIVIGSCEVVVQYWKNMGRHFKNDVRPSRCSITRIEGSALRVGGIGSTNLL